MGLSELIGLPLHLKIQRVVSTLEKLKYNDQDWYISISGGRGSTVLADINKRFGINFPTVIVSKCEQPENLKIAMKYNPTIVNGKYDYIEIINKYGYPAISKQTAMAISRYKNTKRDDQREYRLYGKTVNGKKLRMGVIPIKYRFMIYAPFDISEKCCDFRKKNPLKKYAKDNNRLPITGEMAIESHQRRIEFQKHGCVWEGKKATPFGYWTEKDLDDYISMYGIEISELYDDPNCTRTGCYECMFGIAKDWDRFDRLSDSKRVYVLNGGQFIEKDKYRLVKFGIYEDPIISNLYWVPSKDGLGCQYVLDYIKQGLEN